MERKMKVADFATLLGIVPKTVYKMIERNEVITVTEKVNNRQTTLIVTNDEQIEEFRKSYSKTQVNNGNYYENVTDVEYTRVPNESHELVKTAEASISADDVFDRIMTLNDGYNEQISKYIDRLDAVNKELYTVRGQMLLLEDKAGREGLYINEINELKTDNNKLKTVIYCLLTVIVILLLVLTCYLTCNIVVAKNATTQPTTEQTSVVQAQKKEVKPLAQPQPTKIKK